MKRKVEYYVEPEDSSRESLITCFITEAKEYYSKVGGFLTKHTSMLFTKSDVEHLKKVYTDSSLIDDLVYVMVHAKDFEDDYCLDSKIEKNVRAVQEVLEGDCESIELRFVRFLEGE